MPRRKKDAEYYQQHRGDDVAEWEDVDQGVQGPRRRLNAMVSVRLTPAEEKAIRAAADRRDMSLSAFMRAIALREAQPATWAHSNLYDMASANTGWMRLFTAEYDPAKRVQVTTVSNYLVGEREEPHSRSIAPIHSPESVAG